jgi:hypothetical protein
MGNLVLSVLNNSSRVHSWQFRGIIGPGIALSVLPTVKGILTFLIYRLSPPSPPREDRPVSKLPSMQDYYITIIGSSQHTKSQTSEQSQTVSTDTTIPQISQVYFVPFLLIVFAAGFLATGFFATGFFAEDFAAAFTAAFFGAGFFVAIRMPSLHFYVKQQSQYIM